MASTGQQQGLTRLLNLNAQQQEMGQVGHM